MIPIFTRALARSRGTMLGWGLVLILIGYPIISAYDVVAREQETLAKFAKNFAPFIASLGGDPNRLASPVNYLSMRCFSFLPLVLGVFAVLGGSGLLVSDEEAGTLDLVLAHPIRRSALFFGRLLAFGVTLLVILTAAWLGLIIPAQWTTLPVGAGQLLLPFVSLLALLLLLAGLALMLSFLLPSRRLAGGVAGVVLVISFFVTSIGRVDPSLVGLAKLTPLYYYQSGDAINGLKWGPLVGLFAVAGVLFAASWWLFEKRDIRVAGEGGWRWPVPRRREIASADPRGSQTRPAA